MADPVVKSRFILDMVELSTKQGIETAIRRTIERCAQVPNDMRSEGENDLRSVRDRILGLACYDEFDDD